MGSPSKNKVFVFINKHGDKNIIKYYYEMWGFSNEQMSSMARANVCEIDVEWRELAFGRLKKRKSVSLNFTNNILAHAIVFDI